jgi:putative addiction module killer protein
MNVLQTERFSSWFVRLKDKKAKARIQVRIDRAEDGNFGDHKFIGDGVSEMRIDYGPGYRVYYTVRDEVLIVLLAGGDKSSQHKDIKLAQALASKL